MGILSYLKAKNSASYRSMKLSELTNICVNTETIPAT